MERAESIISIGHFIFSTTEPIHATNRFCQIDKMSNEPPEKPFPRTQIQFGGFRDPSRAIRKIHMDTDSSGIQSLMKGLRLDLLS